MARALCWADLDDPIPARGYMKLFVLRHEAYSITHFWFSGAASQEHITRATPSNSESSFTLGCSHLSWLQVHRERVMVLVPWDESGPGPWASEFISVQLPLRLLTSGFFSHEPGKQYVSSTLCSGELTVQSFGRIFLVYALFWFVVWISRDMSQTKLLVLLCCVLKVVARKNQCGNLENVKIYLINYNLTTKHPHFTLVIIFFFPFASMFCYLKTKARTMDPCGKEGGF